MDFLVYAEDFIPKFYSSLAELLDTSNLYMLYNIYWLLANSLIIPKDKRTLLPSEIISTKILDKTIQHLNSFTREELLEKKVDKNLLLNVSFFMSKIAHYLEQDFGEEVNFK